MAPEPDQGGGPIDAAGSSRGARSHATGLSSDTTVLDTLMSKFTQFDGILNRLGNTADKVWGKVSKFSNMLGAGPSGGGTGSSRINMPMAGTSATAGATGGRGTSFASMLGGGGKGGGSGLGSSLRGFVEGGLQPAFDLMNATSQRIGRGAEYSLQADRMSVQLQQMYGMSNAQVRNQLRMPLTSHYLLGGGTAINDLLGMQASTGLTAAKQASTVEAFRTVSGFSLGSGDVTRMLSTMASPDVANRMFMMGGTGMYGMGGKERTGMQTIQDIVRRTGLTNPEALKGALQQGSNTRQRLNAMGVPQDMQDMVIQYAMQNTQYQKATGNKNTMYDPSKEADRETMGIEGSYVVQHEKTTGERLKREERFYGRQVDNFAQFEKNLRTTTKVLAAFEDALSGIIGMGISAKGHPVTQMAQYGAKQAYNRAMSGIQLAGDVAGVAAGAMSPTGDPTPQDEKVLESLQGRLSGPIRQMMMDNPNLHLNPGGGKRSSAYQEAEFKRRYRPRPDLKEKTKDADRIWNGVVWEHVAPGTAAMAPPGMSFHEQGLAVDFQQTSKKDMQWLVANAAKYGLATGATGRGGPADEPFHIQPAGLEIGGSPGGKSPNVSSNTVKSSKGMVSTASAYRPKVSAARVSSEPVFTNAGAMAADIEKAGVKAQFSPTIAGIDKPRANIGDPASGMSSAYAGGAPSIVIAPNIYLNGTGEITSDIRRIAREVGKVLEQEVSMTMARSQ